MIWNTLDTKGLFSYSDSLPKSKIWECAHPHYTPSGDIINYQVQFFPEAKYVIYQMNKDSKTREIITEIPVKEPAYMHSFGITANYIILVEFPLFIDPQDLLKGGSFSSHYKWKNSKEMRILVVNRKSKELLEFMADPVFAWHHINSFEQDGIIYIDMAGYQDATTFISLEGDADPEHKRVARFVRYKVLLDENKVIKETLGPSIEMPRIYYDRCNGRPYDYVYGYDAYNAVVGLTRRGLVKIDTKTRHVHLWLEDGCIAEEPVFVPKPQAKTEDDGVVLALVLDTKKRKSFLLIVDAKKFKEIGRVEVPHHIPYGLHGDFFPKN